MPPISQTRSRPVENAVGTDTGLEDVESSGCYFAGYAARWVSGASIAANDQEMASGLSRKEASGDRTMLSLIEEEQQLSAAVMVGGNSYKATIDTGATASFVSEKLADNIAALGRITKMRRQVRLADGRCGGTYA